MHFQSKAANLVRLSLRASLPLTVVALLMLASDGWCQQELRSGKKGVTNPAPVTSTAVDADTQALDVAIKAGSITLSGADGATLDGANSAIRATVFDRTNSNPVATQLVDSNGDPVSVGGGTQYSQGTAATDTDQLMLAGCVRADTAAVPTGVIDGDRVRCIVDSAGLLWVRAAQSGTWNIGTLTSITNSVAVTGTFWQATQPISAASLPLPTGAATAANQDGIIKDGTGDTTQANVTNGRLNVDGSGVTQPVSGSVTVTQGTGTNLHVVCDSGCSSSAGFADNSAFTFGTTAVNPIAGVLDDTATNTATENSAAVARITAQKGLHVNIRNNSGTELGVSGAPLRTDPTGTTTQPISASSLPLPTGAATLAEQQTQTTALQLIDNLPLAQGATTSGQNGVLVQGAVTTSAPTYTTGNTNPISLQTDGSQRIAVTNTPAVTQSGTWTVQPGNTQNTTAWLTQPQGNVAHDAVDSGNPTKIGCHARTTNRTAVADADRADVVCDDNGQLVVTPMAPRDRVVRSGVVTVSTTTKTSISGATVAQGRCYDWYMFAKPNDSTIYYRLDDITAGSTIVDSSVTTTLPTNTAFMGPVVGMSNGTANTTVTTVGPGINRIYIESDH